MKFDGCKATVWVFAAVFVLCFSAHAAQGGKKHESKKGDGNWPVTFAINHAAELTLNDEQIKRLSLLQDFEDKVVRDPAVKEILVKLRAAKKDGDDKALATQQQRMSAAIKEHSGGQVTSFVEAVGRVLKPDQMATFASLRGVIAKDGVVDPKALPPPGTAGVAAPAIKNPFDF